MTASAHQIVGRNGEDFARRFLEEKGYRVVGANYRAPIGEIDFICEDAGTLVFVEVKTRRSETAGNPEESVTLRKQRKLYRVAEWYLNETGYRGERPVRFDVVAVTPAPERASFSAVLFPNAFSF